MTARSQSGVLSSEPKDWPQCRHMWGPDLWCDGVEHFYPCVMRGCNARAYFCKHTRNDRHCPRGPR